MTQNLILPVLTLAFTSSPLTAQEKPKKDRTATVTGILKARIEIKNRKDLIVEILGDGDEKVRRYGVPHVPKETGSITAVLPAVQRATVGDRVYCELLYGAYGYEGGFVVTTFQVLKKASPKKDEGKETK